MKLLFAPRRLFARFYMWALLLATLTAGAPLVWGQTATGRISGTVLDPTGAAIPAAQVTIRSESSGATFAVVTSSTGGYTAIDLPAGFYAIEVEMPGFRRHVVQSIKVDVATEASLPPIRLEIGDVTFVVEVEGGVSQVQTTTAELTSTVTKEQIQHLPIIGRSPILLIALEAGTAFAGAAPTVINGMRTSFSNVHARRHQHSRQFHPRQRAGLHPQPDSDRSNQRVYDYDSERKLRCGRRFIAGQFQHAFGNK